MKLVSLVFVNLVLCIVALGQALSKQNVIDLKNAGVSDAVLIEQIQKDGIGFEVNAQTTLDLKKAGLSNEVLNALLKSSKQSPVAEVNQRQASAEAQVRTLYDQQRYAELADHLKKELRNNPLDFKSRSLLILSLLKLNDSASADQELNELQKSPDPEARKYVQKVEGLLALLEKQRQGKAKFLAALESFNVQEASDSIEQLAVSPLQKEFLHVIFDSYRGSFESAHARLAKLDPDSFSGKQQVTAIDSRVKQTQEQYKKLLARAELYIHSPYAPSSCFPANPDWRHEDYNKLTVADYLDAVSGLFMLTPLNDSVLDMVFHAEMLIGDYPQVERLGDRILAGKGTIRLPFFSKDKYFDVVIDNNKRRIYSVVDPRPFVVQYPVNGSGWRPAGPSQKLADHNDWNAPLAPFDLSFSEITSVTQHVPWGNFGGEYLKGRPYALKLSPVGQAPNYAVMLLLGCTAGSQAQQRATRNLGQYVVHVIGKTNLTVELVDPSTKPTNYNWMGVAAASFWGGMAVRTNNAALADASSTIQNAVDTAQANGEASQEIQQNVWSSLLDEPTRFLSDELFADLENLLGLRDR